MKKTSTRLADGRELHLLRPARRRRARRRRPAPAGPAPPPRSEIRRDPLLGDSVAIASHRQGRTYHPPADECPLCPSRERPAQRDPGLLDYDVVVFENRFPSLAGDSGPLRGRLLHLRPRRLLRRPHRGAGRAGPRRLDRPHRRARRLPGVEQVFCFENRGAEIGVTLGHPHGQIYALPVRHPAHRADAALARRAPGAHRRATSSTTSSPTNSPTAAGSSWRPSTGSPSCRTPRTGPTRCTSTRSRRVPDLLGARRGGAHRVPADLPGTPAALRPDLRRRASRRRRTSPAWHQAPFGGWSPRRDGRLRAPPRAFHHPPHFRQAEVPRGFRVRHERVHQRRAAGDRGRATARGSES